MLEVSRRVCQDAQACFAVRRLYSEDTTTEIVNLSGSADNRGRVHVVRCHGLILCKGYPTPLLTLDSASSGGAAISAGIEA